MILPRRGISTLPGKTLTRLPVERYAEYYVRYTYDIYRPVFSDFYIISCFKRYAVSQKFRFVTSSLNAWPWDTRYKVIFMMFSSFLVQIDILKSLNSVSGIWRRH